MEKMKPAICMNKKNIGYYLLLFILGVFFFFFLGENGYILEKDSYVYLEDNQWIKSYGYIVYPFIINTCKAVFAEQYLTTVFVIQGIVAMFSSLAVTEYVRISYRLTRKIGVLVFVLSFGPYVYTLPQYVASHGIMTEGITFPLFNLWMICALQIYRSERVRWCLLLFVISTVMTLTRPQLLLFFVVNVVIILDRYLRPYFVTKLKKSRFYVLNIIFSGLCVLFICIVLFGSFVKNAYYPQLTDAVAGRVLCTIEEEDEELYSGEMKQLFCIVYDAVDKQESREQYFRNDIKRWEDICNATNENTKLLGRLIVENLDVFDCPPEEVSSNKIKGAISYPLLIEHWDRYFLMTLELILQSLVVAIFIHPDWAYTLGYCGAIILYILGILLAQIFHKKNESDYVLPMRLNLIVITILCGLTNIIFMGLQRYVVYPFGWFYISMIVMLCRLNIVKD